MPRLIINNLGPINTCDIEIKKFMVLTGHQSAGKSTIAKAIFFFKTIKETVINCKIGSLVNNNIQSVSLVNRVIKALRNKFLQIFGTSWTMDNMRMKYYYTDTKTISVYLTNSKNEGEPNFVFVELCQEVRDFLSELDANNDLLEKNCLERELDGFFEDDCVAVYIPAGRSMLTLLSHQINYIFATMDESQRRMLDYCTWNYIERILKLKPIFARGIEGLLYDKKNTTTDFIDMEKMKALIEKINFIMQGKYKYIDGEERLILSDNAGYIKINFTSSGQQEALWILNLIFYYALENKNVYYIIEEPESHLYPNAQRIITEIIAFAISGFNQGLLTTHSPYVLGAINNLIYGKNLFDRNPSEAKKVLEENKLVVQQLIDMNTVSAGFVSNGTVTNCFDYDIKLIDNKYIDGASDDINNLMEQWMILEEKLNE